jgi:four helix bundle protein
MVVKKFEELIAWQKAQDLAVQIYSVFDSLRDYTFRNQICGAVVSVSNNIAEGFDRSSDADFVRFLYISISSASETKSMVYLAARLKFIDEIRKDEIVADCEEVARIIRGLIKSIANKKSD